MIADARENEGRTFVLVHGAWHGAWCWAAVADRLRAAGHRVHTPTLTGLGERADQLSASITLETFVADVRSAIEANDLHEIVLVGHSFGGAVVLGVADAMPERIGHLVLLDAVVLESGQSVFDTMAPEIVAARREAARAHGYGIAMPVPPVTVFGIPIGHPDAERVERRLTPQPIGPYETPLHLGAPIGNGRPCTYIRCSDPSYAPLEVSRALARRQPGWTWREIATGHDAMITAPAELSRMLMDVPLQAASPS